MRSVSRVTLTVLATLVLGLLGSAARADIPTGYKGTPFDPKVAGGPKCPATVQAGPYAIPGRLDFVNYDLGGEGISYHTGDHITKGGTGYRTDTPTATFSLTSNCIPNGGPPTCTNVWYDSGTALDNTPYPSATTADFSIGAVQNGDWMDITVNVAQAGTYALSSTWASGAGPPGGEGGDGSMGLEVFSNGTMLAMWKATFPNFNTEADFHHWKPYPNFATVTLAAGLQVIKLQSLSKHLQMDYVQFELVGADGGVVATDGGASADDGGGAAAGTTGTAGTTGASGSTGAAGADTTGAAGDGTANGSAGATATGTAGASGTAGVTGTGTTGTAGTTTTPASRSSGCSIAPTSSGARSLLVIAAMAVGLVGRARRRRAP